MGFGIHGAGLPRAYVPIPSKFSDDRVSLMLLIMGNSWDYVTQASADRATPASTRWVLVGLEIEPFGCKLWLLILIKVKEACPQQRRPEIATSTTLFQDAIFIKQKTLCFLKPSVQQSCRPSYMQQGLQILNDAPPRLLYM